MTWWQRIGPAFMYKQNSDKKLIKMMLRSIVDYNQKTSNTEFLRVSFAPKWNNYFMRQQLFFALPEILNQLAIRDTIL